MIVSGAPSLVHLDTHSLWSSSHLPLCAQAARTVQFPRHRHFRCGDALLPFNPSVHSNGTDESRFLQQVHLGKQQVLPLADQASNSEPSAVPGFYPEDEVLCATTSLLGLSKHVQKVVPELPFSPGKDVRCWTIQTGLTNCTWSVDEEWFPSPGGNASSGWVTGDIERVEGNTSRATSHVRGMNTRGCRIYFDQPVYDYKVRAFDGG